VGTVSETKDDKRDQTLTDRLIAFAKDGELSAGRPIPVTVRIDGTYYEVQVIGKKGTTFQLVATDVRWEIDERKQKNRTLMGMFSEKGGPQVKVYEQWYGSGSTSETDNWSKVYEIEVKGVVVARRSRLRRAYRIAKKIAGEAW
jgi:hypothetical protein